MKTLTSTIALAATAIALLVPGCSTDKPRTASSSTSSSSKGSVGSTAATTATTSSTVPDTPGTTARISSEAHPAVAAELDFWNRYIEITGRPGPVDLDALRIELSAVTTGAETSKLFEFVQGNVAAGRLLRGSMDHSPRLASVEDTTAVVEDCIDDMTGIYTSDGARVDTDDPRRHLATVGLQVDAGTWKVASVSFGSEVCDP